MSEKKTEIMYPGENEHLIEEEPFWKINLLLRFRGFEDGRKVIWFLSIVLKTTVVASTTMFAYTVKNEPNKFAACVATIPAIFMAVYKLFYLYFHTNRVRYLLDTIYEEFWDKKVAGEQVEEQINRRFLIMNLILSGQFFLSLSYVYFVNAYPLLETSKDVRRLPNPVWTPFDTNPSPLYEVLYLFMLCNQIYTILGNGFYDFAYHCATQHLCAQLLLLKEQLRRLTTGIMPHATDSEKFDSVYFQRKVMERLKICVKHHCKLLKYGKNFDKYSANVLLPQLIMSYLVMVVNGYILTTTKIGLLQTVEIYSFTLTIFTEFVVFAVQASDLKDQSISVIEAVMSSEWYLFKAPIKRALVFLMLNAQKGIVMTVGGMIEVDNPLIISVVHKAFSAITLLKAIIVEEQ